MFGNLSALGQSDLQRAIDAHEAFVHRIDAVRKAGATEQELRGPVYSADISAQAIADGDGPLALAQLESGMAPWLLGNLETQYLGSVQKYVPDQQKVIPSHKDPWRLSGEMKIGLALLGAGLGILVWRRYK